MIVVLSGGTGAAKFLQGLQRLVPPADLVTVVNTGDDLVWWGLYVSPDVDSVVYGLAGVLSRARGWGVEGDTFECRESMGRLGAPDWFSLGDRDLATHLLRTHWLNSGRSLSSATTELARRLGVASPVLPMSDERVETRVATSQGELSFQEYFVRERHAVAVSGVSFVGAQRARPAPGVLESIAAAEFVIVAPSNPVTSIGPILAVPGIRDALRATHARIAAVTPIVGGAAVSGPAAELMQVQGLEPSIAGVAKAYADFLDVLVADERDRSAASALATGDLTVHCCDTMMVNDDAKLHLARQVLGALGGAAPAKPARSA
jgi:LPPG:FO 2-phospho-L-lactate transferase